MTEITTQPLDGTSARHWVNFPGYHWNIQLSALEQHKMNCFDQEHNTHLIQESKPLFYDHKRRHILTDMLIRLTNLAVSKFMNYKNSSFDEGLKWTRN